MKLRYYQEEALVAADEYLTTRQGSPCIVLPTGAGKTIVIAELCRKIQSYGGRVLVLAHVKELLEQASDKLLSLDSSLDVGVYSASLRRRDTSNSIICAGVQSVYNKGFEICQESPIDVVIVDEAHRIPLDGDGMYRSLLKDLKTANPKTRTIGLTATPYRTGSGWVCGPDNILTEICYEVDIKRLIKDGFLCPLRSRSSKLEADTGGLRVQRGDFVQSDMSDLFEGEQNVAPAVEEILALTQDRNKALLFCCSVAHATDVAMRLESAGESVRVVTSQHEGRDSAVEAFRNGDCKFLVNVNVLTEGFDVPSVDCVALLRSTASPGLYYQMCGRGLRIDPSKKDCLILDYGQNVQRHGTLDDLQVKETGKGGGGEAPVKSCPECMEIMPASTRICPACGHEMPIESGPRHGSTADSLAPIAIEAEEPEQLPVEFVSYSVHRKEGKPDSLKVSYHCGLRYPVSEWVSLNSTSDFAVRKARQWWRMRSMHQIPETIEEAVQIGNIGGIAAPRWITVEKQNGYDRVADCELEPTPPVVDIAPPEPEVNARPEVAPNRETKSTQAELPF